MELSDQYDTGKLLVFPCSLHQSTSLTTTLAQADVIYFIIDIKPVKFWYKNLTVPTYTHDFHR